MGKLYKPFLGHHNSPLEKPHHDVANKDQNIFHKKQRYFFPIIGFLSLIWVMLRVIPKPSRAVYPCQKAALPLASGFLAWLAGLLGTIFLVKNVHKNFKRNWKYGIITALLLMITLVFTAIKSADQNAFADDKPFIPTDSPNSPVGEAKGIFPGRVTWAHNPDAVNWNGNGYWWEDKYNDQKVVEKMLEQSLKSLTGEKSSDAAWTALFTHFNQNYNRGNRGYQSGEKIAIKLNLNSCNNHSHNQNGFYVSPHMVLALLKQLVYQAHINQSDITFYDATRNIPSTIYDKCIKEFPKVNFKDWEGGDGRQKVFPNKSIQLKWSAPLTLEPGGGNPAYLPVCVTQADYLINLAQFKGHNLAGVTFCSKNLFGSFISSQSDGTAQSSAPKNAGVHPYVCVHSDFHFGGHWDFDKRDMGTYNPLVDLLGHQDLGQKTILFMIDGLYSAPDQSTKLSADFKWHSAPFNNNWPSSLFLSEDPIALESVALDFLRNEDTQNWVRGNVDNYLHEAALAANPASGTKYDPEADGTLIKSLGVHEHWNNTNEKLYSGNMGKAQGIELIKVDGSATDAAVSQTQPQYKELIQNFPNPFNGSTVLVITLPKAQNVQLDIFDYTGRFVATIYNDTMGAGENRVYWTLSPEKTTTVSGLYFARIQTTQAVQLHSMIYLK